MLPVEVAVQVSDTKHFTKLRAHNAEQNAEAVHCDKLVVQEGNSKHLTS